MATWLARHHIQKPWILKTGGEVREVRYTVLWESSA